MSSGGTPDAVVIGAGHNGLVAANVLADHGWDVVVLEAQPEPGGAVQSAELTLPGFTHDLYSAFYPMAMASPAMRRLDLEAHGLRWRRAPVDLAHPRRDGTCAFVSPEPAETAAALDAFSPGDGDAWTELYGRWTAISQPLLACLLGPFPPVLAATGLLAALGPAGALRLARTAALPVRRLAAETFRGEGGGLLLAGNAMHSDIPPDAAGSGVYGWLLASLAQQVGFPVPEGGAGQIAAAMVGRLRAAGGQVLCGVEVTAIEIRGRRAVAVRTTDGRTVEAGRAVIADVPATDLYLGLVGEPHLPPGLARDLEHFQWDLANVKVDWALDGAVPWSAEPAREAATVHVCESIDDLARASMQLSAGRLPDRPPLIVGQQCLADPTRAPAGRSTLWAYTHVPRSVRGDAGGDGLRGLWDDAETARFAERMEGEIEAGAPGFRDRVLARRVMTPRTFSANNGALHGGAVNGGTAQLHQQLVLRPTPGLGRPETFIRGLFLASSSAHPGGGVHGAPGANAARAALAAQRRRRSLVAAGVAGGAAAVLLTRR